MICLWLTYQPQVFANGSSMLFGIWGWDPMDTAAFCGDRMEYNGINKTHKLHYVLGLCGNHWFTSNFWPFRCLFFNHAVKYRWFFWEPKVSSAPVRTCRLIAKFYIGIIRIYQEEKAAKVGMGNQINTILNLGPWIHSLWLLMSRPVQFRRREALLDPTRNRSMTGNLSIAEVAMALWVAKHHQISSAWFHFGLNISTCDDYIYIYIYPQLHQ